MAGPIPESWRTDVVRILRTSDRRLIEWTLPALQGWETDTFGNAEPYEAEEAMIKALERDDVVGNETTSYRGQCGTYEFFFPFGARQMYGKIALYEDRLRILILSAHKPKRPTL